MENESEDKGNDIAQILLCYKRMAIDKNNHKSLIKDKTMVQFLAYSLDSSDREVILLSLDTISLFIENNDNHDVLKSTFGVLEALKSLIERNDIADDLKAKAASLQFKLESPSPIKFSSRKLSIDEPKKTFKTHTFHVFGLSNESRNDLESSVIRVRGVVSVVIDPEHQRCTIRASDKVTPELLAETIYAKTTLDAQLVIKNRLNQEVLKTVRTSLDSPKEEKIEEVNFENSELPAYLPEEDTPIKEKAVHPFDRFKTSAAGWVKTATSLLQNSFYW